MNYEVHKTANGRWVLCRVTPTHCSHIIAFFPEERDARYCREALEERDANLSPAAVAFSDGPVS